MTLLLVREDREYLLEPGETLETDLGVLELPEDANPGDTIETHLGEPFQARRLRGPDLFHHLQRTGAPMMPQDIGLVIGRTGIAAGDRVLDAGTGTGVLATFLGRLDAQVITYEKDEDFADVARQNLRMAGVDDMVQVRTADVTRDLDDLSGFDHLTLDTRDAPAVVERAPDVVIPGGFVAVYSPFVEAARETVEAARQACFDHIETLENIQREMDFDRRGSRPSTTGVGHTGYLTFARNR